jgi:hypothetical protein
MAERLMDALDAGQSADSLFDKVGDLPEFKRLIDR